MNNITAQNLLCIEEIDYEDYVITFMGYDENDYITLYLEGNKKLFNKIVEVVQVEDDGVVLPTSFNLINQAIAWCETNN